MGSIRRLSYVGLVLALLGVLSGCGPQTAAQHGDTGQQESADPGEGPSGGSPSPLEQVQLTHVPVYPLSLYGKFTAEEDGRVVSSTLEMAGRSVRAYLYPPAWDTDQWPPELDQPLRAGHPMAVHVSVYPLCDGRDHQTPLLTVTYDQADGSPVTRTFSVASPGESVEETARYVDEATDQFCAQGILVSLRNQLLSADRQSIFMTFDVVNPGTDAVTVTSRAWESGEARWLEASIDVPADGERHKLRVHAVGPICNVDGPTHPFALGLLSAAGPDGQQRAIKTTHEPRDACAI